jgi:hypothetical protein
MQLLRGTEGKQLVVSQDTFVDGEVLNTALQQNPST